MKSDQSDVPPITRSMRIGKEIKEERIYHSIFDAVTDGLIIIDLETGCVLEANPAACAMHGYTREEFIGLFPNDFIHIGSQQIFRNYLQGFRSGKIFDTQALHLSLDGSTFHAEWRGTSFSYKDSPCLLGVIRDVSKRIQAEEQLQQRIDNRTREQATLLDISHTLASTLELQPGLILDQLWEIIEYIHAGLFGLTDSTLTALAVRTNPNILERPLLEKMEQVDSFQVRLEGPEILAALFNGHQPIRIPNVWSNDPEAIFLRSVLNGKAAFLLDGVGSWMWVPLAVRGRIIGGIGVAHPEKNYFTIHHANLVLSMADQVAITMVNAELYENARSLATLQERQRLARNLHDAVNQSLFSAGLIAEVLPRLWERNPTEARQALEDVRRLTRGALAEMRELLAELRPSTLTDSSLDDLLHQLANAFTGRTNITVTVNSPGDLVLPSEIQVVFYRICQEALNNIAKHADANHVEIELQYEIGNSQDTDSDQPLSSSALTGFLRRAEVTSVEMVIRDDGLGFDTSLISSPGHYGLTMMRERAESAGAQLIFTSQPGQGTQVTLTWSNSSGKEVQ